MTRAQQIRRPHVLANFRPTKAERSRKHVSAQRRREGNDEKYAALLRQCPCVVTLKMPAGQIHHLKGGIARNERGVNMRATDKWGLPLSYEAHILGVERVASSREHQWFRDHGIEDPYELAAALYSAPRDVASMTRIILAHRAPTNKTGAA